MARMSQEERRARYRAKKYHRRYYAKARQWAIDNRDRVRAAQRKHYHLHKEQIAIKRRLLRDECFAAYGNRCACCGEARPEFLSIDHINGRKSSLHRAGITGKAVYKWLKARGFPKDEFRLLCYNCNCARGHLGYCPHEKENPARQFWLAAD